VVNSKDKVDWGDRKSTPYVRAFIHEAMRMRSILNLSFYHSCVKDTTIAEGKYFIPRGCALFLNIAEAMQDPCVFSKPQEFRPERFMDDKGQFSPDPRVIPFGLGRRRCIGDGFAMMSIYIFFCRILKVNRAVGLSSSASLIGFFAQDYHVRLADEQQANFDPIYGLTVTPRKHILQFTRRKKAK